MKKQGFTLVELLVVVLIIGILSSVALPQYTKAVNKAKGSEVLTTMNSLSKAFNMAYLEDGGYRRSYYAYSGVTNFDGTPRVYGEDFDIDVPGLKEWSVFAESFNNNGVSLRAYYDRNSQNPTLTYRLSEGKLSSITCSGSKCSEFFPSSILSSN